MEAIANDNDGIVAKNGELKLSTQQSKRVCITCVIGAATTVKLYPFLALERKFEKLEVSYLRPEE